MIKKKEMVLLYIQMGINTKENGKIINNMERVLSCIVREGDMKENGLMDNLMD